MDVALRDDNRTVSRELLDLAGKPVGVRVPPYAPSIFSIASGFPLAIAPRPLFDVIVIRIVQNYSREYNSY